MRKIFSTVILCFLFSTCFAQLTQGTWMLGGTGGLSFSKNKYRSGSVTVDQYRYSNYNLSPNVGYFVMDNLALGLSLNINNSKTKDNNDKREISSSLTTGPFGRYYFPIATKFAIFGHANIGFGFRGSKTIIIDSSGLERTTKSPTHGLFNFGIGPGFSYFINEHIGLEATLLYNIDREGYEDIRGDKVALTTSGINLGLGFQIYL